MDIFTIITTLIGIWCFLNVGAYIVKLGNKLDVISDQLKRILLK